MSDLKLPPSPFFGRTISPYSLYRQPRSKAFSGIIRPKLPISPISIGTAATRRHRVVAALNITAITQVPRPKSHTKRTISAICCRARRSPPQGIESRKRGPGPTVRKVEISTTGTARRKSLSRDCPDFSCRHREKKPKIDSKTLLIPWTRGRRFLTQPQAFPPRTLSNPPYPPLSAWDDFYPNSPS